MNEARVVDSFAPIAQTPTNPALEAGGLSVSWEQCEQAMYCVQLTINSRCRAVRAL